MSSSQLPDYVIIRPFHPSDQDAVFRLWYDGFAELFWEGASEVWTNKKFMAALGLGSSVSLAALLRSPASKDNVAVLAAICGAATAAVWALSAPALYWSSLWKYRSYFTSSEMNDIKKNWVEAKGRAFWVACLSDGTVVGATGLRMERPEPASEGAEQASSSKGFRNLEEGQSELLRMTVSDKHRRLKLGSQLLAVLEAHAKASGMKSIVLSTAAVPAMSFYERNGYLVTHETHMGKRLVKSYQKSLV